MEAVGYCTHMHTHSHSGIHTSTQQEGKDATQDPTISQAVVHQQLAAGQTPNLAAASPSSVQVHLQSNPGYARL